MDEKLRILSVGRNFLIWKRNSYWIKANTKADYNILKWTIPERRYFGTKWIKCKTKRKRKREN